MFFRVDYGMPLFLAYFDNPKQVAMVHNIRDSKYQLKQVHPRIPTELNIIGS